MESSHWDIYADNYHEFIVSPLREGIDNPLFKLIQDLDTEKLVVADLGCGRGDLVPFLAQQFKHVYAVDFSPKMLSFARRKTRQCRNITLRQADMRTLTDAGIRFDVAVCINSIIHPSPADIHQALVSVHACLSGDGHFVGVFPAMESILYYGMLVFDRERMHDDEDKAMLESKRIVERSKYSLFSGVYDDNDGERQKLFYRFELQKRLMDAGFSDIMITKVVYPWGTQGDYQEFPDMPGMWDWFVTARKRTV